MSNNELDIVSSISLMQHKKKSVWESSLVDVLEVYITKATCYFTNSIVKIRTPFSTSELSIFLSSF